MFAILQNRVLLATKTVKASASGLFFSYSFSYSSFSTEAQRHMSFLGLSQKSNLLLKNLFRAHKCNVFQNQTETKKTQEKPYVGDLGQNSFFLMVPLLSKEK